MLLQTTCTTWLRGYSEVLRLLASSWSWTCSHTCSWTRLVKQFQGITNSVWDLLDQHPFYKIIWTWFICVCYHKNFLLHKDGVNSSHSLNWTLKLLSSYSSRVSLLGLLPRHIGVSYLYEMYPLLSFVRIIIEITQT